jgi:DNA polymerase elongation subunit (family B)
VLNNVALDQLLLFDIETTPLFASFNHLPDELQRLWEEKITKTAPDSENPSGTFAERAGLYAEFGKIVCISVGLFFTENGQYQLRIKSFYGHNEKELLAGFTDLVEKFSAKNPRFQFAGHNIKEFDIPYICRRAVINSLPLPVPLQIHQYKPWELPLLDTLQLWRFGDFKNYTSLKLLAAVLGIPTPKDDIDGSMVGQVYWNEQDLPRIVEYCQKDVLTVGQLLLRFKGLPLMEKESVSVVN